MERDRTPDSMPDLPANTFVVLALLTVLASPLAAVVELLPPIEEAPPTTEDLNGVAAAPNGDYIAVGNNATVLHRTTDPENNPIWTPLNSTCILTPQEQANIVGYFAVMLGCDDGPQTGDEAAMSAVGDFFTARIRRLNEYQEQRKCQRAGAQAPANPLRPEGALLLPQTADFELLTVGTEGRVQRLQGSRALFFDDFETGDFSFWSSVTP